MTYAANVALPVFAHSTQLLQQSTCISFYLVNSRKPAAAGFLLLTYTES